VITHRDLGGPRGESLRKGRTVGELKSRPVVSAAPTDTLRRAPNLMRGRTIGCLPIVEGRRVVGIISVTDLLETVGRAGAPRSRKGVDGRSRIGDSARSDARTGARPAVVPRV
jgi:CBS domain-containing protein